MESLETDRCEFTAALRPTEPLFARIDDPQATVPVLLDPTLELEFEQLDRELRDFAAEPARQLIARCGLIDQRVENFPEGSGRTTTRVSPGSAPSNHTEFIEYFIRAEGHETYLVEDRGVEPRRQAVQEPLFPITFSPPKCGIQCRDRTYVPDL